MLSESSNAPQKEKKLMYFLLQKNPSLETYYKGEVVLVQVDVIFASVMRRKTSTWQWNLFTTNKYGMKFKE